MPVDRARDEVGDLARTFAVMQQRLLQQEEARRAFVATASHELRTPLATLDGMLELLHEDLRSGLWTSMTRSRCSSAPGRSRAGSAVSRRTSSISVVSTPRSSFVPSPSSWAS